MNLKIAFISVASIALFTSCFSPKPVLRFKPEETNTTWEKGKEFVSYKQGEYEVYSSYYGCDGKYIIFDIEVVNNKGDEFLVAPEKIKMYKGMADPQNQKIVWDTIPTNAIDPEEEILKIELQNSRAEASSKNSQVALAAILSAAIPIAIIASSNDYSHQNRNVNIITKTDLVEATTDLAIGATVINQANQEDQINSLNDTKYNWEASSLRKTTLSTGYSIRGLVYFPIPSMNYQKIRFEVPTPLGSIVFKYDFLKYYPTKDDSN